MCERGVHSVAIANLGSELVVFAYRVFVVNKTFTHTYT